MTEYKPQPFVINRFFYITHSSNIQSILERGILCHARIESEGIAHASIYDKELVMVRSKKLTPDQKPLTHYANLYIKARNPMLFKLIHWKNIPPETAAEELAVLVVKKSVLDIPGAYVSDGNLCADLSTLSPVKALKQVESDLQDVLTASYWNSAPDGKRRGSAECIVPDHVPPGLISEIYVPSIDAKYRTTSIVNGLHRSDVQVKVDRRLFFLETLKAKISDNLTLIRGDMFFSQMQTQTIPVNCIGVMGAGYASAAKYMYPAMYVMYQDLCKKKVLLLGKPYLYRNTQKPHDLSDEPVGPTANGNGPWLILFPTKHHYKEQASIDAIEKGILWLSDNCEMLGIQSLAVPALGCGLGRLKWEDVGPILCRRLSTLKVPVEIYLPDRGVPEYQLRPEFLLDS